MHALLVICLLLVPSAYGSTATTFFYNKTNATLLLDYYSNAFGSFTQSPPAQVGPYSSGNWSMSGSLVQNLGWMEYDVYWKSPAFQGCVDVSYFWDLVVGLCGSSFATCADQVVELAGRSRDCYYYITDQCSPLGNPIHILTTDC